MSVVWVELRQEAVNAAFKVVQSDAVDIIPTDPCYLFKRLRLIG